MVQSIMKQEILIETGLTVNEAKVYLALLKIGSASVNEITRSSGVHRVNVYDVIDRLIEKGLISSIMKKEKRFYEPANPEELLKKLQQRQERLRGILPELTADFENAPEKQEVHYFKGPDGVITAYYMMLEQNQTIFAIGGSGRNRQFLKHRHVIWDKERRKLGINGKWIYYESARKGNIGGKNVEIRFLPDKFYNPAMIDVCGNLVLILLATDTISCIVIDNKDIADAYRKYFELMWQIAKK